MVRNLVNNPKCPLDISLTLIKTLMVYDLKSLRHNKNVPDTIRKVAAKLYTEKATSRRKELDSTILGMADVMAVNDKPLALIPCFSIQCCFAENVPVETMVKISATDEIGELLKKTKTIAVVGLSDSPLRPSYGVSAYMQSQGYRIIPVNPSIKGALGEKAVASLSEVGEDRCGGCVSPVGVCA